MVIRALDLVPNCYTWSNGDVISKVIRRAFAHGDKITISFAGVTDTPSSFVNAAFISLLSDYSYDFIKSHLTLTHCSRQVVDMIKRRFDFERSRDAHAA